MRDKVGVYFCIEKFYAKYKLSYVIKNINTGQVFIKIKKLLKSENSKEIAIESLEYILNNVISLIKIEEISNNSEISIFTNNKCSIKILSNKLKEEHKNIKFFLDKLNLKNLKEFNNVNEFINKEKKVSIDIYLKCKKAGKEYRKFLKRNSTISILNEKLQKAKTLIFFDFEMNCLVNFKDVEIISIGACKVDLEKKMINRYYSLIKPKGIQELTEKCIEITSLNQEEIDNAKSFNNVFNDFSKWVNDTDALFLYWGGNDISVLKNDYRRNQKVSLCALSMQKNNIDFQEVLCKDILNKDDMLSLKNGLLEFNLEFVGEQHNSGDDAYNLFRLFREFKKNH